MVVKIVPNDKANPPGKLADAELHFTDGVLEGLKLVGFAVWERGSGSGRNVTFPARQYSVNGDRRSFALLRPVADAASQERVRDLVLEAYAEHEHALRTCVIVPEVVPREIVDGCFFERCVKGILHVKHGRATHGHAVRPPRSGLLER
jgi:hypothetical protein